MNILLKFWTFGMDERQVAVVQNTFANAFFFMLVLLPICLFGKISGHSVFADNHILFETVTSIPLIYVNIVLVLKDAYIQRWHKDSKSVWGGLMLLGAFGSLFSLKDGVAYYGVHYLFANQRLQRGWTDILSAVLFLGIGFTFLYMAHREKGASK